MKKLLFLLVVSLTSVIGILNAEESLSLNTPYVADPRSTQSLRINQLNFVWGASAAQSFIEINLTDGVITKRITYAGQDARDLLTTLNKMNFTTVSLEKRIFNKLISDGYVDGSVVGNPD